MACMLALLVLLRAPIGLKEHPKRLHADLLARAGHTATHSELISHFPGSSGLGRLLLSKRFTQQVSNAVEFIMLPVCCVIQLSAPVPNTLLPEQLLVVP